jgi:hypothetical protein
VAAALEGRDVDAVELDRPARRPQEAKDHLSDRRLAAPALADQRDDLAGPHRKAYVVHRKQLRGAERSDGVRLAAGVDLQHQATAFAFRDERITHTMRH